jgi:transcriptional regulator with XRE-family HTH domain
MGGMSASPFGRLLRHWRIQRGVSQLDLALAASVSARHVSFLETGRSRPGVDVILRLGEALDLSPRDQNDLFLTAGLPPHYPTVEPGDPRLAPHRRVLELMLKNHEPFPCLVLDRWWNVLDANAPARKLFGVSPPMEAAAVIDLLYGPGPLRAAMVNWSVVAWSGLTRLRRESRALGLPSALTTLTARVEGHLVDVPRPAESGDDVVVCPVFEFGGVRVRTVSTITQFSAALDVGLDEVRIEHVFPGDHASEQFFRSLG